MVPFQMMKAVSNHCARSSLEFLGTDGIGWLLSEWALSPRIIPSTLGY